MALLLMLHYTARLPFFDERQFYKFDHILLYYVTVIKVRFNKILANYN